MVGRTHVYDARRLLLAARKLNQALVVFDNGKRIVEVVKLLLPLLEGRGLAEPYGVRLQIFPVDEQKIATLCFKAALQLVGEVARRGCNQRRRGCKGMFKRGFFPGANIENGGFQDHAGILTALRT